MLDVLDVFIPAIPTAGPTAQRRTGFHLQSGADSAGYCDNGVAADLVGGEAFSSLRFASLAIQNPCDAFIRIQGAARRFPGRRAVRAFWSSSLYPDPARSSRLGVVAERVLPRGDRFGPARILISVDLPAPFTPTSTTRSPRRNGCKSF